MKKIISLVLTLTLLVSVFNCMSFTTNAATTGSNNNFEYSIENDEVTITDYFGSSTTVTIPSKINGYPVTTIGVEAFRWHSLTSVTIPNSVTTIGNWAFEGCDSLTSITIPNSVTSIGDSAFLHCSSLTSITLPDSAISIGSWAFSITAYYNDENNWENGALYIGNHLIEVDSTVTTYTIKDGTKRIAGGAFRNCSSLLKVTIPESVVSIGDSAFRDCEKLTNIKIPDSVKSIGNYAFENCSFKSITIPKSVEYIGVKPFNFNPYSSPYLNDAVIESIIVDAYNKNYSSQDGVLFDKNKTKIVCFPIGKSGEYVIPNTVTAIDDETFYYCRSLTSITIPDSVKSIGNSAFNYCTSLKTVIVGNGVTSIGDYAFERCWGLQNITLGNSVESIGEKAFYDCYWLSSIDLPESVKSISDFAFEDCTNLESVTIRNDDIELGDGVFYNCNNLTVTCNENSNAQEYCEEWSIPYNYTMGDAPIVPETPDDSTQEQYIIGDVDLNGTVDIFDLIMLAKMIVGA